MVTGQPGAGKSTFLAELERRWPAFRCIRMRGVESEAVLPFASLQQLLYRGRDVVDRLPDVQSDALRAAMGLQRRAETDPYLVSVATLSLISEMAADGPLLISVDDVPWVDAVSREALLFVCRRLANEAVAVVLASRSNDWPEIGDEGLPVVDLGELDATEIAALVANRSEIPPQQDVARRVAAMTAGNPLAALEFVAELSAEQLRGRAPLPAHLPLTRGLERTYAGRIDALPAEVQRALLVIAADDTGRRDVVETALPHFGVEGSTLERAVATGFAIQRDDAIDLRHPLIRSAVYARASVDERRRVHRALAEALRVDEPDRAVWHRASAASGRDAGLAAELRAVASHARARGALEEAMSAWERAAELEADRHSAADALLAAAKDGWAAGRLVRALGLLDRVAEMPLIDEQRTEAGWVRGGIELASGDAITAYRTLVLAADVCQATDPERALLILNLAAEAGSLANDRSATSDLAAHAPAKSADMTPRHELLDAALHGFAADFAGDTVRAFNHLRRSIEFGQRVDDPALQLIAGRAAIYAGDDEAARSLHRAVVEDARRRGAVDLIPLAAPRLATAEVLLGLWPSAIATATESSRIADETGQLLLAPHGRIALALIAAMRGEGRAMEQHLGDALRDVGGRPMGLIEDDAHWARGLLALGAGQYDEALAHVSRITHPVVQLLSALDRAEVAAATGDRRLREWVAPVAALAAAGVPWAVARHQYAAILAGGTAEPDARLAAALEAAERSARPFERARIQLGAGSMLRRNRRRIDARPLLRAAAMTFDLLGAQPWSERAHAELRASGETVTRSSAGSVEQLTPQELQVARAVADGHSNKEVAARLFLSPRTVEFHLRNVFGKLGVTSRAQLARVELEDPAGR